MLENSRIGMVHLIVAVAIFLIIILFIWLGNLVLKAHGETHVAGPLEGALIGLLALMLSFSFNVEYNHFNERRYALYEETNAMRGTMVKLFLLPDSLQNKFRPIMKNYIQHRIDYYRVRSDERKISFYYQKAQTESIKFWEIIKEMGNTPSYYNKTNIYIESFNQLASTRMKRENLRKANIPGVLKLVIFTLICTCAFVIGYNIENLRKKKIIVFSFSIMISLASYLILDLENSRTGLITLDDSEMQLEKMIKLVDYGTKN